MDNFISVAARSRPFYAELQAHSETKAKDRILRWILGIQSASFEAEDRDMNSPLGRLGRQGSSGGKGAGLSMGA